MFTTEPVAGVQPDLWTGVDRLVDRFSSLDDLRAHRLHLLAGRRWRGLGLEIPDALATEELMWLQRTAAARLVLRAVRDACSQRMVILKGPAAAACYPDAALRPFVDLDILVENPEEAQRELLSAGFEPIDQRDDDYYVGLHHMRPLRLPGRDAPAVELHRRPNWVDWVDPPPADELLAAAVPGPKDIPGMLVLPAEHEALALAAHSWGETPLRRLLDLVDVAAVSAEADQRELHALAGRWGLTRLWRTTIAAVEALIFEKGNPWSLRLWARDLRSAHDRTVFQGHLRSWLSPFWALPPHRAALATVTALARDLTPAPTESWENKLTRIREALSNPARPNTEHERILGPAGIQPRIKRR
jgi:hypothetical protein